MSTDRRGAEPPRTPRVIDGDALVELVGAHVLADPDNAVWSDERFLQWLAAEERRRAERRGVPTLDEMRARGEALLARVQARAARATLQPAAPCRQVREPVPLTIATDSASPQDAAPLVDLGVAAGVGRALWDEPVEEWIEIPPEVPPGRYIAVRVVGDSMAPLMHTGDVVLLRLGSDVDVGSVIVARHPEDGYVCKRVDRVRRDRIELVSLAPDRPRIVLPRDARLIVGTVVLVWCTHR